MKFQVILTSIVIGTMMIEEGEGRAYHQNVDHLKTNTTPLDLDLSSRMSGASTDANIASTAIASEASERETGIISTEDGISSSYASEENENSYGANSFGHDNEIEARRYDNKKDNSGMNKFTNQIHV